MQQFQYLLCLRRNIRRFSKLLPHPSHHTIYLSFDINVQNQSMIWDIIEQSNFDKHFQNQSLTIEQLLVDENILTEMQNLNPQLLNYIRNNLNQVISKLVRYVIVMPVESEGYDRCHRLPYVSSQMLAINNQIFYEAFLPKQSKEQTDHLKQLFGFLTSPDIHNELLLGYFEKVTGNLYKGRKLQFTKAVTNNLQIFSANLDKQTIGIILKNCVILLDTKQGVLYDERKKIVSAIISTLVEPKTQKFSSQTRQVCSDILIQITGRHRTYSSGDELLNYILNYCGQLLLVYSQVQVPEICRFFIGVLEKSTQKIYDPERDDKVSIFKIPASHQMLLQGYLPLKLNYCKKLASAAPAAENIIKQQDGSSVVKIHKQVLDFLTLVQITLENDIDQFLLSQEEFLNFAWQCMRQHPKNDIALVRIIKIFAYLISERSKNKEKLHQNLIQKFKIVDRLCEIFSNPVEEKKLRPHLFELWEKLKKLVPKQIQNTNKQWKNLCEHYQKLVPLHTKTAGLNYERPTNQKLLVDQQQAAHPSPQNQQRLENFEEQATQQTSSISSKKSKPPVFQEDLFTYQQNKTSHQKLPLADPPLISSENKNKVPVQKQQFKSNQFNEFDSFFKDKQQQKQKQKSSQQTKNEQKKS